MKKIIIFAISFFMVSQQLNLFADKLTQHGVPKTKDPKGYQTERGHEEITVISYAKEPLYVGVFEKRADKGQTPHLFGDVYKLESGNASATGSKETLIRPTWDLALRRTSGNDRVLYFTTDRQNLGGDDTVAGIEPINSRFLSSTDCENGKGCLNIGEGFFSTRKAFVIYPVNAQGEPDLNGAQLKADEDSKTIEKQLADSKK